MSAPSRSDVVLLALWFVLTEVTLTVIAPPESWGQSEMLPPTAGGWTRTDTVGVYVGKDLFLLVDGGADLFFEYGFVRALSSDYAHTTGLGASTELYEMKDAAAAYGLYTSFTVGTGAAVPVGQEAVLGEGYCIFWKGASVGMLTAAYFDSSSGPKLLRLAGGIAGQIRDTGGLPRLCALLREGGFEPRNMAFVRGRLALGNQLPHPWASSFAPTEGVVGTSGTSGASHYLVMEFADQAAAGTALATAAADWERLRLSAAVDSAARWRIPGRDDGVTIVERRGRHVLAATGRGEEPDALASRLRRILTGS